VGFDQRVAVMSSLRKPKVVIVRGNDGREYKYLVKAGEDLRQDQRIQQLFCQMNGILNSDGECKRRELKIRTYRVVPMTTRLGLIEFLPNVTGLKDFVGKNVTAEEEHNRGPGVIIGKCYQAAGIFMPKNRSSPAPLYNKSYKT
jgi:DNA-dependent protein kinase catalytic subunit